MDAVATLRDRPARVACALLCLALNTLATPGPAQVDADQEFDTAVARPAFAPGEGPTLRFDEAHRNLQTASGRYAVVAAIAGAGDDAAPAFARGEIAALVAWIEAGGSLFLIADHAPFGSAAAELGAALGVTRHDGSVDDAEHQAPGLPGPYFLRFSRDNGLLGAHPILAGRAAGERISTVVTFGGQALEIAGAGAPLLRFGPAARAGVPDPFHFGMTYPGCDNKQLLLNSLRWLARVY